jgi:hypothetical protein
MHFKHFNKYTHIHEFCNGEGDEPYLSMDSVFFSGGINVFWVFQNNNEEHILTQETRSNEDVDNYTSSSFTPIDLILLV